MGFDIDLRPLFWFFYFGLACAALLIFIGIPMALWWVWNHVSIGFH